jgi:hypothetical protein
MSVHINRFVDRVRSAEHRAQRDFVMTMAEARDLQADLTKLLLALHQDTKQQDPGGPIDNIQIDGGRF